MDYLELQTRANLIVDKVNLYEESLTKEKRLESDLLNMHKYCDTFCIRPLIKLLLGDTIQTKLSRTLSNDIQIPIYASSAPMWNTKFGLLDPQPDVVNYDFNSTNFINTADFNNSTAIANNFTTTKFIISKTTSYSRAFDIYVKFKINKNSANSRQLVGQGDGLQLNITPDNTIQSWVRTSSSWAGTTVKIKENAELNKWYIVRAKQDTNSTGKVTFYLSEDNGQSYTLIAEQQRYCESVEKYLIFGGHNDNTSSTSTTVTDPAIDIDFDLSETKVKEDNISIVNKDYTNLATLTSYIPSNVHDIYNVDQHEFMNSIDLYNKHNMITLDQKQALVADRDTRIKQGINYSISSNIQDALVTESQVANVFDWNTTTDEDLLNNTQTTFRQVPGIVLYYLGNGYDNTFSANVGCNDSKYLNSITFNKPCSYGVMYMDGSIDTTHLYEEHRFELRNSQRNTHKGGGTGGNDSGAVCRIFMPGCTYTRGKLESPQQIWQPIRGSEVETDGNRYWTTNGINYQGKAIYHELVFKSRRKGTSALELDFVPGLDEIPDNDPQGFATRLALAKQKDYYINRAWFNELDVENKFDSSLLADKIEECEITTTNINSSIIGLVGNPTIDDKCNVSNFSASDYITVTRGSKIPDKTTWTLSFTTPSNVQDGTQYIANGIASSLFINQNGDIRFYTTSGNTITAVEPNTKYKLKIVVSENKVEFFVNDSTTAAYTYTGTYTTSATVNLGFNNDSTPQYFKGIIHLDECSVLDTEKVVTNFTSKDTHKLTDSEFYNNYKLDYNTYADVFNQSK